ncbi:MAG: hypothetical protein JNM56_15395 [Planctomycetia bacterium]|nr:hypothetical protein [Planctomycetia bacterium]
MKTSTPETGRIRMRPSAVSLLFGVNLALAAALVSLVLVAPWLHGAAANPSRWSRLFLLFGEDAAVRRTALAAAMGLVVTACVFFRAPAPVKPAAPAKTTRPHIAPPNVVGA